MYRSRTNQKDIEGKRDAYTKKTLNGRPKDLRKELTDTNNILSSPNPDSNFILGTNAIDNCLGAILTQKVDSKECPIAFQG